MFFSRRYPIKTRLSEIDDAILTLTKPDTARLEWACSRRPVYWFFLFCLSILFLLGGRLVYLTLWRGTFFQEMARKNSLRSLLLQAPRGIITDRFGEPLVRNVPTFDALIIPSLLTSDEAERTRILNRVNEIFLSTDSGWQDTLKQHVFRPGEEFLIQENIGEERAIRYLSEASSLPGIFLRRSARREYVNGPVFSPVLGYEGKIEKQELGDYPGYQPTDSLGKQGIEKSYESRLRGKDGRELIQVDALGHIRQELGIDPSQPGHGLTLTIDKKLSEKAYTALAEQLQANGLSSGAVIALDPRSGEIRALISYPSYDNNLFSGGIEAEKYSALLNDPAKPLFDRAISGIYPPGSTIKPVIAAAALTERLITPNTVIVSNGGIRIGNAFFGDWKAHGATDLRRAIAVSSDVYFYSLGGGYGSISGLGMERMKRYEEQFGLGSKTGIDLPGEATGFLPDPAWKERRFGERWYIGDDYHAAIGQGFVTATPLQIVNAIATIANGGTVYTPHLWAAGPSEVPDQFPKRRISVGEETLQVIREGMRETVTEGTAQSLQDLPVLVAGKTGTAQYGNQEKTHGWFVSFAPYDHPELAVIVLVEGQRAESSYHAVPITKKIYEWYFHQEKETESSHKIDG